LVSAGRSRSSFRNAAAETRKSETHADSRARGRIGAAGRIVAHNNSASTANADTTANCHTDRKTDGNAEPDRHAHSDTDTDAATNSYTNATKIDIDHADALADLDTAAKRNSGSNAIADANAICRANSGDCSHQNANAAATEIVAVTIAVASARLIKFRARNERSDARRVGYGCSSNNTAKRSADRALE
jgi:hypothetical protein